MPTKDEVRGFVLTVETDGNDFVELYFPSSHHAECVLRGLVHSGYTVTISEQLVAYPKTMRAMDDHERKRERSTQYGEFQAVGNADFDRPVNVE